MGSAHDFRVPGAGNRDGRVFPRLPAPGRSPAPGTRHPDSYRANSFAFSFQTMRGVATKTTTSPFGSRGSSR